MNVVMHFTFDFINDHTLFFQCISFWHHNQLQKIIHNIFDEKLQLVKVNARCVFKSIVTTIETDSFHITVNSSLAQQHILWLCF